MLGCCLWLDCPTTFEGVITEVEILSRSNAKNSAL